LVREKFVFPLLWKHMVTYIPDHLNQEEANKNVTRRQKVKANILNDTFKAIYLRLSSY
jgi:PhoPQ-activated pathogenicity-related protein